jgi:hypothetical protein
MTDCLNKNAHAFKPRIAAAPGAADLQGHSMGCNCKKSECLKKYCEVRRPRFFSHTSHFAGGTNPCFV